jgi:hypothetical protein
MWEIAPTKRAFKDAKKIARSGLKPKVESLIKKMGWKSNPHHIERETN